MEMESDHLHEMAAMDLGQDLHDSSTEQHGELSTRMSHVEDAGSLPHPSPYATSSLSAQPSGPCQESNDVEMAASPPSISDSTTSISQDLSSYPSRLWNARAIVTTSGPGENVQRCLLTSTTIPVNDLPSSDYPRMSEQIDHATNMYTEYDKDIEDDREHVDNYSDGVHLHSAAPESFVGISLPSSSPANVLNASNPGEETVISDDDDSEDDQTLAEMSLQTPKRFPSVGPSSFQANYGAHVGQIQTRPAREGTTPRQQQGFTALSTPVPAPKGQEVLPRTSLRQSSVLRYSDVKKVGAKAEIADFDTVVTTRESSADPEVHTEPQADSAAATLIGTFRRLVDDASAADIQQVKWLKWAETQCGDKRTGGLWTKDTLLRNLKREIQAKLQGGQYVFILQKMPPAVYKGNKVTTCGHFFCPAPKPARTITQMQPGAYRLSLEPISHLGYLDIPLAAAYTMRDVERPASSRNSRLGKGKDDVVWYCLSCVEDLWDGVGMIQAMPNMVNLQRRRPPPQRMVPDLSLVAAGGPSVLPGIRPFGLGTAASPPALAARAFPATRGNLGHLSGSVIADLSSVAAGEPSVSPFSRPLGPRSSAMPGTSVFASFSRNPANTVISPDAQGASLRITPGSLGVPGSGGQERHSVVSNFDDRYQHGMFGFPSPHPRPAAQRQLLVPQSRIQDPVSNQSVASNFDDRFQHGMFGFPSPHPQTEPLQRPLLVPQSRIQGPVSNQFVASNFDDRFQHGMFGFPSPHPQTEPLQRPLLVPQSRIQGPVSNHPAQANQQMNDVSLAEPRRHTGNTVPRAAVQVLPSDQHHGGSTSGASSLTINPAQVAPNLPPAIPSLKPHNNWPRSVPNLASISQFIHPETRRDPTNTGYYALSSPQLYAFRKWKAVHTHAAILENEVNRKLMEEEGLHHEYAEQGGVGEIYQNSEERRTRGVMKIGGFVVEVRGEEVKGRRLSQGLAVVDTRVENELAAQGWVDNGPPRRRNRRQGAGVSVGAAEGAGEGSKKVKLTLKRQKEEGSGDEVGGEGDAGEESEDGEGALAGEGKKKAKSTLRMGPVSTESPDVDME